MARLYKVSADTSEKEKAVGGIMTFGQAGWLVLGFVIDAALFLILAQFLPPVMALILAVPPGLAGGLLFAFYKIEQIPLFTYLMWKYKFRQKNKKLVNTLTYGKTFLPQDELFQ